MTKPLRQLTLKRKISQQSCLVTNTKWSWSGATLSSLPFFTSERLMDILHQSSIGQPSYSVSFVILRLSTIFMKSETKGATGELSCSHLIWIIHQVSANIALQLMDSIFTLFIVKLKSYFDKLWNQFTTKARLKMNSNLCSYHLWLCGWIWNNCRLSSPIRS